jgi:hypothetical protein
MDRSRESMTANEDMIAYSRYKQIGDENLYLMEKVHQQQAEITNKKLVNDTFADLIKLQGKKIDEQQAEIEKLKVEKIRAYDNGVEDGRKLDTNPKPAKTLTDDEIIEIWSGMETDTGEQNIAFAKAILKRAFEK